MSPAPLSDLPTRPLRRICELVVGVAIVSIGLRTWFVQGLVVPMTVSGGSMASTLHGPHLELTCPDCNWQYACGLDRLPASGLVVCPNCGHRSQGPQHAPGRQGDRLLVDRTAYERRLPDRWEVVVFRCPDEATSYCVKRVVGLPGESVQIRRGDVYINGRIARKGLAEVRAVAQLVHDASFPSRRNSFAAPGWLGDRPDSAWQSEGGRFVHVPPQEPPGLNHASPNTAGSPPRPPIDWLTYRHRGGQPVRDDYGYNQNESRLLAEVADLRLSCYVTAQGVGTMTLRIADLRDRFEVVLHPSKAKVELKRNDGSLKEAACDLAGLERGAALELSLFDRQLLLAIDGRLCLEFPYEPSDAPADPSHRPLAIGAAGLAVAVEQLKVWRDIHYTHPGSMLGRWGLSEPLQLKADEMFVLGDNSPISHDSRSLPSPAVPVRLLVGKPLGVRLGSGQRAAGSGR